MENTQIEVAANVAQLPTSAQLADRLALLTTERDKAYSVAVAAQRDIDNATTAEGIATASDEAEKASNRHETIYRAVERVEAEIAEATAQANRADQARAWTEYSDTVCQLIQQGATQKILIEETVWKLAQEIEDAINNALDELADAERAHTKTNGLILGLKKHVVKHSYNKPGQTYDVPARTVVSGDGSAVVMLASTESDWEREESVFDDIITRRGLSLESMEKPAPNAQFGAARFLLALRECQRHGEELTARFSNVAPKVIERSSTSNGYTSVGLMGEIITEPIDTGPARQTNPELFRAEHTAEIVTARREDAQERADQTEAFESEAASALDRQRLDNAKVSWSMQEQVERDPNGRVLEAW
jgi:hypothetical protein